MLLWPNGMSSMPRDVEFIFLHSLASTIPFTSPFPQPSYNFFLPYLVKDN